MWKPTSDFIIVEEFDDKSRIALPQNVGKAEAGKTFIVLDTGPGQFENGMRIPLDIQVGDRVAIVGKMLNLPFKSDNGSTMDVLIARAGDCIAYERNLKLTPKPGEEVKTQLAL